MTPNRATILDYHPAGYLGTDADTRWGRTTTSYRFTFIGTEPEPVAPEWMGAAYDVAYGGNPPSPDSVQDRELRDALRRINDEIDSARVAWAAARYTHTVTEALREAVPAWQAYRQARAAAAAAYAALDDTPDNQWRAALLRLARARAEALAAAEAIDTAACPIADAWDTVHGDRVLEMLPRVEDLAARINGLDGWDIVDLLPEDYRGWGGYDRRSPTQERLARQYAEQDKHIAEVTRLAGMDSA